MEAHSGNELKRATRGSYRPNEAECAENNDARKLQVCDRTCIFQHQPSLVMVVVRNANPGFKYLFIRLWLTPQMG